MRRGATAFDVSAHVLLLFESPSMVVQLTPSFPTDTPRATADEIVQHLRASLGERYRRDPAGDRLYRVVRTDEPRPLRAEIAHVEHVLGRRAARRFGPSPRSQDRRRWQVVEALRASWPLGSSTFTRRIGDEHQRLFASIGVLVESATGRPGLAANVGGWVPRATKRWTQSSCAAAAGFAATAFRVYERTPSSFFAGRWGAGLSPARASKQADAFDQWLDASASSTAAATRSPTAALAVAPWPPRPTAHTSHGRSGSRPSRMR
jgi:hypothetical protein